MTRTSNIHMRVWLTALFVVWVALQGTSVQTQQQGGTVRTDKVQPVNGGANPYRVIRDWAQLSSEGRPWGGSNGVAIDRDGKSVWATDRCSPGTAPGCLGTKANPVHRFDESGKEIRSFGGGIFVWPHGIHVDRDGNVWVTDARTASLDELKQFLTRQALSGILQCLGCGFHFLDRILQLSAVLGLGQQLLL